MPSTILDSAVFRNIFTTEAMRKVWSDENRVQKYLDFEKALAIAQARLGIIPQEACDEIVKHCTADKIDMAKLKEATERIGYPVLPVVQQLVKLCKDGLGEWSHWGATTQDITDTATVMQIREGLDLVEAEGAALEEILEAARGGDDHVRTRGLAGLLLEADAAVHRADAQREGVGDLARLLDDLRGELAGRGEDQRGGARCRVRVEAVQQRDHERERLAGAGRALGEHVAAFEDVGKHHRLNRQGALVPARLEGAGGSRADAGVRRRIARAQASRRVAAEVLRLVNARCAPRRADGLSKSRQAL